MARKSKNPDHIPGEIYFGQKEEEAVFKYIFVCSASTFERTKLYEAELKRPIQKLIESIIRRYKLFNPDMPEKELQEDTLSFLFTKIDKFNPNKMSEENPGKKVKAYSYFGTIVKNYLASSLQKRDKELKRKISYEDFSSEFNEEQLGHYQMSIENEEMGLLGRLIDSIDKEMLEKTANLSDIDIKIGKSLILILKNYSLIFEDEQYISKKFSKQKIILEIKEMTRLKNKDVISSLKKYKSIYKGLLN